jgi:hypothetical protein
MSDTSPKDAVNAVAYAVCERSNLSLIEDYDEFHLEFFRTSKDAQQHINDEVLGLLEAGLGGDDADLVSVPLVLASALSQVRKQALLEAAEICDKFDVCDPKYIKEAIRKLAEEE